MIRVLFELQNIYGVTVRSEQIETQGNHEEFRTEFFDLLVSSMQGAWFPRLEICGKLFLQALAYTESVDVEAICKDYLAEEETKRQEEST